MDASTEVLAEDEPYVEIEVIAGDDLSAGDRADFIRQAKRQRERTATLEAKVAELAGKASALSAEVEELRPTAALASALADRVWQLEADAAIGRAGLGPEHESLVRRVLAGEHPADVAAAIADVISQLPQPTPAPAPARPADARSAYWRKLEHYRANPTLPWSET